MKEGNNILNDKAVSEAVKWVVELHHALPKLYDTWVSEATKKGITGKNGKEIDRLMTGRNMVTTLAEKLDTSFEEKLSAKITSKMDSKIKENGGTIQRIRNIRKNKSDVYSVNLQKAVVETLDELGLWSLPAKRFIYPESKVAPNYFEGHSANTRTTWLSNIYLGAT